MSAVISKEDLINYEFIISLIVTLIYNCIMKLSVYCIPSIMMDAQYPNNVENRKCRVCIIPCLHADIERLQIFHFSMYSSWTSTLRLSRENDLKYSWINNSFFFLSYFFYYNLSLLIAPQPFLNSRDNNSFLPRTSVLIYMFESLLKAGYFYRLNINVNVRNMFSRVFHE